MRRTRLLEIAAHAALTALVILACPTRAPADPAPDPKIAHADQLFAEGKALMTSNVLQACDKFDQSLRENPAAIGTLLNVALCDEKLGRVASAFARFTEARDRAKEQNLTEHQRAAEDHLATLAPIVPHVAFTLTQRLPDTTIVIDGRVIELDQLADVSIDPGERVIVVSAPDRLPYRATLVVGPAEHKTIVIPALARSVTVRSSRRRIGQITTIAGVITLGVGIGVGVHANNLYQQQFDNRLCAHTKTGDHCEAEGQRNTDNALSLGNTGTVVGIVGGAVAVAGLVLWLTAPSSSSGAWSERPQLSVVPQLGSSSVGLTALGRF
ncbi:MAG: hypothetical protein ABIY55_05700 [Kofleriaceae bacterium]